MCGIAGILAAKAADPALLERMATAIAYRGPDDSGVWTERGLGLAHRRLSIVDLSAAGAQPMASESGRWVISYNGEIYNHAELRTRLEAEGRVPVSGWRGHSDTETLVEAIDAWGLDAALDQSVGMFALAAWDRAERRLYLARDRFGEKPLYYGFCGPDFVFGSELKAVRIHPAFDAKIDRRALAAFASLSVVPAPMSIYSSFSKLGPGKILEIAEARLGEREDAISLRSYWSYRQLAIDGSDRPFREEGEAVEALDAALRVAIKGQLVADVPVGAFLSGGIDSSLVVALSQSVSDRPLNTFSVGFAEAGYDESHHAAEVAAHLGTIHHELQVGPTEARAILPLLPTIYDEPFADSSQLPTFLLSRFAREEVTVALSGDGGDELFAGYNRHVALPRMWNFATRLPRAVRHGGGVMADLLPADAWSAAGRLIRGSEALGAKARKAARLAARAHSVDDLYASFVDEWAEEGSPVRGAATPVSWRGGLPSDTAPLDQVTAADATGYLPDDILTKVDRASMAVSLETRIPLLDHRVAAVAARMPPAMKVRDGRGKLPLRALLNRHVPRALVDRPKAGFAVPVGVWIRGPLRAWAEALLDERRLAEAGYFDATKVRRRWADHLSGRRDSTAALWSILMFEAWRDAQDR